MPDLTERDGKFSCPSAKCRSKVMHALCVNCAGVRLTALALQIGSWNWAGSQCSCGQWVAPAMQFPMSKVAVPRAANIYIRSHASSVAVIVSLSRDVPRLI